MRRALLAVGALLVVAAPADARVPLSSHVSRALDCGPRGTARVSGSLEASVAPRLRFTRRGGRTRSARAVATLSGRADLRVEASAGAACALEATPIARWNAPPLRFMAGPVPVVVVPRITLYLSAEARATQPLAVRTHGTLRATAGLRYDGRVHRIAGFRHALAADVGRGRATASAGARITPSIELLLYGQAGPRFDFGTGLELDDGRVSVPVELSAGLRLPGLDVGPVPVLSRTYPLRLPSVAGLEDPRPRARVEWDTGGDVDLHVWDESGRHTWFRQSGIPGALLSKDDTDGFGPETFEDMTGTDREFTYGLCYFDDRGAGVTHAAAEITEAGGAVREARATLDREGDSTVLGGPFDPPAGWCQPRG